MATKKDIKIQEEYNNKLKETKTLLGDIDDKRAEQVSLNFADTESVLEIVKARKEQSLFDSEILKSAKALNKAYLDNITSLSSVSRLQSRIKTTEALRNKSILLNQSVYNNLGKTQTDLLKEVAKLETEATDKRRASALKLDKINDGRLKEKINLTRANNLVKEAVGLESKRDEIIKEQLNTNAQSYLANKSLQETLKDQLGTMKDIDSVVGGTTRSNLEMLSKFPIIGDVAKGILKDMDVQIQEVLDDPKKFEEFKKNFNVKDLIVKNLLNPMTLTLGAVTAITIAFSKLDTLQTSIRRNLGESYDTTRNLSSEFSTVSDTLEIANSLTEQFGFNVNAAFSGETVVAASELVQAVGLTAEEAGKLAFLTTISGQNLNDSLDTAVKTVNPLLSQRQLLQQIGNVSSFIALNFDNQVESLLQAASNAKELGLNLDQVNQIADGLLDIESSIANEFQAEVITGKQLNLERARFFALTNDLAGLTGEIAKNQEIISSFETGSRIEQQAIAQALGLSTDELATMIQEQKLLNGLSEEGRKEKELADIKSLALQERFTKLVQTLAEESVVLLEPLVAGMKVIGDLTHLMVDGFKALKPIIATAAVYAGVLGLKMLGAAIAAGSIAAFIKTPVGIATGIVATLAIAGLVKREYDRVQQVGDAFIPAGKGPIISTREGGLLQGTANDDIIMAPGIARGGRNSGNANVVISDQQLERMTVALSKAQLNINGRRASSLLQSDAAVTTYSTSV